MISALGLLQLFIRTSILNASEAADHGFSTRVPWECARQCLELRASVRGAFAASAAPFLTTCSTNSRLEPRDKPYRLYFLPKPGSAASSMSHHKGELPDKEIKLNKYPISKTVTLASKTAFKAQVNTTLINFTAPLTNSFTLLIFSHAWPAKPGPQITHPAGLDAVTDSEPPSTQVPC